MGVTEDLVPEMCFLLTSVLENPVPHVISIIIKGLFCVYNASKLTHLTMYLGNVKLIQYQ